MINIFANINLLVFFISLCIGLFLCYITAPVPKIIIKYPTPDNSSLLTYIDEASNCYKYKVERSSCPRDKSQIKEIPVTY